MPEPAERLPHILLRGIGQTESYKFPGKGRGKKLRIPSRDRGAHGARLLQELQAAEDQIEDEHRKLHLEFASDVDFDLAFESLEDARHGIKLANVRKEKSVTYATVVLPANQIGQFVRKVERYIHELTKHGKPKNQRLVESISHVRLAALRAFWTDTAPFPSDTRVRWWEAWLRRDAAANEVLGQFRGIANSAGIQVSERHLQFPDRIVVLVRGPAEALSASAAFLDLLAELRAAKECATDFVNLPPRDQAEWIEHALQRITPPLVGAPAVCLLDTGLTLGHPLLALAVVPADAQSVNPDWDATDFDGHGTELAGLSLYGDLVDLFTSNDPLTLTHRLESVRILPAPPAINDPELYGAITSEAVGRAEIQAPERLRSICLATTTRDGRDRGRPSSWSAEIDQICAGVRDEYRRLMFVAAGNTDLGNRHEYPNANYTDSIHDPAQAWNALTVGAFTERSVIRSPDYRGWHPVGVPGRLSPSSTTSIPWAPSWPLKPDVVLEGGNDAIDPATKQADTIDDLALLTTAVDPSGRLLTTTKDTSAAVALGSRMGAIIQSQYGQFWPESVRGLIIHSARWTEGMLQEFDGEAKAKQLRLRSYGYGVPRLDQALWSAGNALTLVVQDELQPFEKVDGAVNSKDMQIHSIPWPKDVLSSLGAVPVTMRITLSYFIQPNPGERGWGNRYRYASHGLRFAVRRPTETVAQFRARLSKAAQEEDDDQVSFGTDDRDWAIGIQLRNKGSIHCDWWTGTAAEVAEAGFVGVYPVTGWWKTRPQLDAANRRARYSLIVTLSTPDRTIDLYTTVLNQVTISTPVSTRT
jgi:hypothetical protein